MALVNCFWCIQIEFNYFKKPLFFSGGGGKLKGKKANGEEKEE